MRLSPRFSKLAYEESGLILVPEKATMVQSRLRTRLGSLGIQNFDQYQEFVCSEEGKSERSFMISALTTNVSSFFREPHHFDFMLSNLKSKLLETKGNDVRLRIWSAGCSNGQEPYSIAIHILENITEFHEVDFKILATDIDPRVLQFAKNGKYPEKMISGISEPTLSKYFRKLEQHDGVFYEVRDLLSTFITFKKLNLLSSWPMRGPFDIIFCRNVVIYFDGETQRKLWPRFGDLLEPSGQLYLGHSERIPEPEEFGFFSFGPTAYSRERAEKQEITSLESRNAIA